MNERKPKIVKYYQVVDEYGDTIDDAHTLKQARKVLKDYKKQQNQNKSEEETFCACGKELNMNDELDCKGVCEDCR